MSVSANSYTFVIADWFPLDNGFPLVLDCTVLPICMPSNF